MVVGVFTELKAAVLGQGTRARHLSYLGDTTIGRDVNVGAGTVIANFDGETIQQTHVADGTFIGSGSILVAPLELPARSHIDPGSVVNDDVVEEHS